MTDVIIRDVNGNTLATAQIPELDGSDPGPFARYDAETDVLFVSVALNPDRV